MTCWAGDAAGNTTTRSFTVVVVDTTAPVLSLPGNLTATATGSAGAVVSYAASATDLVDGSVPVACSPLSGSVFPIGSTTVTCTAADARGNTANGTFTVTVTPYQANLKVTVKGLPSVTRGSTATYEVTVTNAGPATATNLRTVLALSGLSVTSTSPVSLNGSVKVQGVTYTGALWATASLAPNQSVSYTLTGTVTAKKGDSVIAQAATTSDVPDPALGDNAVRTTGTVTR